MQILLVYQYFCLQQKNYIKAPKKKLKLKWNTEAQNRTWSVCMRVRYRSFYTIADFLNEFAYNYFKSHCIILIFFFICFFISL